MSVAHREAQQVVVAGLVQRPERLDELRGFDRSWFDVPECGAVFALARSHRAKAIEQGRLRYATAAAIEKAAAGIRADGSDPKRAKRARALRKAVETLLAEIANWPPVDDHEFRERADEVREYAMDERARRGLTEMVDRFQREGHRGVWRELQRLAGDVAQVAGGDEVLTLRDDAVQTLAEYAKVKRDPGAGRVLTPWPMLNQATKGGRAGRLWIVAAYAKDGKTQSAKELVYHAAIEDGRGCLVITGEQTKEDVRTMLVVRHSHKFIPGGLAYDAVDGGTLSDDQEKVLRATVADLKRNPKHGPVSYWQAPGGATMSEVRAMIEATRRKHPVEVVMLDHTMLFRPSVSIRSEVGDLSAVLREAKQIALDSNSGRGLWMIATHQIKREGYEKALTRGYYLPSDCAGSAEAERSADVMLWLWRDDQLRELREIRVGVALNRYGEPVTRGWQMYEGFDRSILLPIQEP